MSRVVFFEIYADNPERAMLFYEQVFGWKFRQWEFALEYWHINTGDKNQPGINGGLLRRTTKYAGNSIAAFPCTIDVPSVDDFINKILNNGGKLEREKFSMYGVGWFAYCKDTEGNLFGIMQSDKDAK